MPQGCELVIELGALECIRLTQLGDFDFLAGLVVGACRIHPRFQLIEAITDERLEVSRNLLTHIVQRVLHETVHDLDAVDVLRVGQLNTYERRGGTFGLLGIRLQEFEGLIIEDFEGLFEAAARLGQVSEQLLVITKVAEPVVVGIERCSDLGQRLFRRQLVDTQVVKLVEILDRRWPQYALNAVIGCCDQRIEQPDYSSQSSNHDNEYFLLP